MAGPSTSARAARGALAWSLAAVLLAQLWAGLSLRGLYADGAFYAEQLLLRQSFVIIEPSRWTSQVLMQAPVVAAMAAGFTGPRAVALAVSLSTNLLPVVLTLLCLAVLPPADRRFGLFPVFVLFAAAMSASFASIADGSTAAAYTWLLLLLVRFGRLTASRLAAILIVAAGALRLHEAMVFLGPIIAFACLARARSTPSRLARRILWLSALLVALGAIHAGWDVAHPRIAANRASFVADLRSLRWLVVGEGQVSVAAAAGMAATLMLPLIALPRWRGAALAGAAAVLAALAALALILPPCPPAAFAARNNACLMTAPAMLLLLRLSAQGRRPAGGLTAAAAALTAMLGCTVAVADGAATAGWLGYTAAMREALEARRGLVSWQEALALLPPRQARAMDRCAWPWTTPLMSLWLAPGAAVETVIANPPGTPWEPFDPAALRPALGGPGKPRTRAGFLALLERDRALPP